MPDFHTRRMFLLTAATAPFIPILPALASESPSKAALAAVATEFARLEHEAGGRLGVDVYDTGNRTQFGYRADERFPMCSTFKLILAGAVLAQSMKVDGLLARRIAYSRHDLAGYSPVTEKHVGGGMTVAQLCDATIRYSDNTAANLLLDLLGGPAAVTAFAKSIGDDVFRLDRRETELNTAIPGDVRDTSAPAAMGRSLRTLVLGDVLSHAQREQLEQWLRGNTTGEHRIRAGLPPGWTAADKTGSGSHGTTNDVALAWPPGRAPISIAVYYTQDDARAKWKDDVIASATRIAVGALR